MRKNLKVLRNIEEYKKNEKIIIIRYIHYYKIQKIPKKSFLKREEASYGKM